MTNTGEIIRTVWTYRVNGEQMGTYDEVYARSMFETLAESSAVVELLAMDHVATDFATTGRNWTVVPRVVATTIKSLGELAGEAATVAARLNDPYAEAVSFGPYFQDASWHLLEAFRQADEQGQLARVVGGYNKLATAEGHRVHRLLLSLKQGRTQDVLTALAAYGQHA